MDSFESLMTSTGLLRVTITGVGAEAAFPAADNCLMPAPEIERWHH
jgi:hypothetical protein